MEIHLKRQRDVIDALAGLLELERSSARQQQQQQQGEEEEEELVHSWNDTDISLHIYSPDLFEDAFAAVCLQDLIEVCATRLVKLSFDCFYTRPWKPTRSDRLAGLLWKLPRQNNLKTIRFMSIKITSPLNPFIQVIRSNLPSIQQFSFQCAFDTTVEYDGKGGLYEMAHALSQASPKRIEFSFVRWTEEPPDKVLKFATILVGDGGKIGQQLEALVLRWLPVRRAELVDPGALSGFFHAAQNAKKLKLLALGSSQLPKCCIQDVANIIRYNRTLQDLSVEVKPGTFMDPLLDALESSNSSLERLQIGVHAVGRQCVSLDALCKLLEVLQTKNYSLKAFNVYSQFGAVDLCWDSEYQVKLEGIEFYVNLNATYPQRKNLLQDENFTVKDLLKMLPIATDDNPDHESISAIYGLLLTNPGFWLASK